MKGQLGMLRVASGTWGTGGVLDAEAVETYLFSEARPELDWMLKAKQL